MAVGSARQYWSIGRRADLAIAAAKAVNSDVALYQRSQLCPLLVKCNSTYQLLSVWHLASTRHRLGSGHRSIGDWPFLFLALRSAPLAARKQAMEALLFLSPDWLPRPINSWFGGKIRTTNNLRVLKFLFLAFIVRDIKQLVRFCPTSTYLWSIVNLVLCQWLRNKNYTVDSGGIRTHDLLPASTDVLTSRPPSLPDNDRQKSCP